MTVPWFSSTMGRPPVLLLEHPGLPIQARIAAVSISTAVWAIFLKSRYSTDCSLNAGPHLEGHKLVRFETCCEDFLGQILGKFRVPFRVCQRALEKSDRSSEVGRVASAMGGSSEMRLKGCTCPFRQLSVVPAERDLTNPRHVIFGFSLGTLATLWLQSNAERAVDVSPKWLIVLKFRPTGRHRAPMSQAWHQQPYGSVRQPRNRAQGDS